MEKDGLYRTIRVKEIKEEVKGFKHFYLKKATTYSIKLDNI
ncbi:MAG: hypothetical protein ABR503_16970 [Chitinophagaceae bacterium]